MSLGMTESVIKRDRMIVMLGLAGVIGLSWLYTLYMAWGLGLGIDLDICGPLVATWGTTQFLLVFGMWSVMMVAMMAPSVSPFVLMFATINRKRREQDNPFVPTSIFFLGYLLVWIGYSALATIVQWGLHSAALLSPFMVSTSPYLGGALLIGAGLFQWTPIKHACLDKCRSPLGFMMTEWRDKAKGALIMGLKHGYECVMCCWMLMLLLFVAGVMNLLWMGMITAFLLIEKLVPAGDKVSKPSGVFFILCGVLMIVTNTTFLS